MTKRVIAFVIDGCFIGLMAVFLSNYISVDKTIVATAVSTIICMSVMECSNRHGSLGKIIMGLVVTAGDNDEISMLDGWTRNVLKFLPAMLVGVFYDTGIDTVFLIIQLVFIALPFCNKRRIAFHDAIAGTHVTKYIKKNSCSNMDKEDVCANELILKGVSGEFGNMELPVKETLIFGRDEKSCNFVFNSAARGVSRMHCKLDTRDGLVYVTDLGSTNGTTINDKDVLGKGQSRIINPGDLIKIGYEEILTISY